MDVGLQLESIYNGMNNKISEVRWASGEDKTDYNEKQEEENLTCVDFRAYVNCKCVLQSCYQISEYAKDGSDHARYI